LEELHFPSTGSPGPR